MFIRVPDLFWVRLDERHEFIESHPPAGFVVQRADTRRQILMEAQHVCTAVRIPERECDRHLALHAQDQTFRTP